MSDDYMKALEIQRRNFEAQFGNLESLGFEDKTKTKPDEIDSGSDEEDEFDGFSNESSSESESQSSEEDSEDEESEDEAPAPKVIKLSENYAPVSVVSKKEERKLRQGRAPTLQEIEQKKLQQEKLTAKQLQAHKKEDEENLENDIQLQRLLEESHILANQAQYSGADVTLQTLDYEEPTGKARKKALTSRIRKLASTNSATGGLPKKLESMPMAMRKGMIESRKVKIAKYEQEAKDAGIILSKVKKGQLRDIDAGRGATFASDRLGTGVKEVQRVRDRGLKINSIGRSTRNGLMISKEEISRINGAGKSQGKKRRR